MRITVKQADITELKVDAIVNPANSQGLMGGGVALAIKKAGGQEIEDWATAQAPIPLGDAIITSAGKLKAKCVIHAPTMEQPAEPTTIDIVKKAVLAALKAADESYEKTIAFPGMGTGVGCLDKEEAAKAMIEVIKHFNARSLQEVILVGRDLEMAEAFKKALHG